MRCKKSFLYLVRKEDTQEWQRNKQAERGIKKKMTMAKKVHKGGPGVVGRQFVSSLSFGQLVWFVVPVLLCCSWVRCESGSAHSLIHSPSKHFTLPNFIVYYTNIN